MSPTEAQEAALSRTAQRYARAGRFTRHYVAGKLRHDPVVAALFALGAAEHFGDVADLGCGRGQLGIALIEAGVAQSVSALDCKPHALTQARVAAEGLRFEARQQDFSITRNVPQADTILLIDVLYQLDTDAQAALLASAAAAARSRIIIRSADPASGLRSLLTQFLETAFRRIWPHSGARVNPRPLQDLTHMLHVHGFTCTSAACWSGTPFSNTLLVARRDANQG